MKSITQNMRYLQSLMSYAQRYGVSAASRKYNRTRSFIYFWRKRWDGSMDSLQYQSRRPHAHPNQHTEEELKLIRNMRRRNPDLGIIELWCRLRERGYSRCVESLYRVMKREGLMPQKKKVKKYVPKPYEQMTHPGERIQIDVKVVPRKCIADSELRLYQYTAIDEYSRYRVLGAYPEQSTFSSTDFLKKVVLEFTNRFSTHRNRPTLFEETLRQLGIRHKLIRPYTPRHNGKVERSHREDQKRFYNKHSFYSLDDFGGQLAAHQRNSNKLPMRPLHWLSPLDTLKNFTVQYV